MSFGGTDAGGGWTCDELANAIAAAADGNIEALGELGSADLSVIAWVCKLVPAATLNALRSRGDAPLDDEDPRLLVLQPRRERW